MSNPECMGTGNIGYCPCRECTKLEWQASIDWEEGMSLADYRRSTYPEIYNKEKV